MKKYLVLIAMALSTFAFAQATYYTCATSGQNTTNPDGVTACAASTAWNAATNILIVRNGTTLNLSGTPFNLNGSIIIEQGGTLVFNSGSSANNNNNAFNILANAVVIVDGTFQITSQNTKLSISSAGLLIVNSTGTLTNSGSGNSDIIVDGNITGSGTIEWTGSATGSGTINGQPVGSVTSPLSLDQVGFIWNGTSWSPSAPVNLVDRAIFNGNYSSSADGSVPAVWPSDAFTVNTGFTVIFNDNDDLSKIVSAKVDGILELVDNVQINKFVFGDPSSTGNVRLRRTFPNVSNDYTRMGFPVKPGSTWGDVVTTGFLKSNSGNSANFYYWDAATSTWTLPTTSTPLAGTAFAVFPFSGTNRSISVTVPIAQINNADFTFNLFYNNPGPSPIFVPGPTDGWNQLYNPFIDDMSSQLITGGMASTSNFQSNAISIWDGTQYKVWSNTGGAGNDADAEFVRSFEAFFVQTVSSVNNTPFTITEDMRANGATSTNSVNYFKTSSVADGLYVTLDVTGNGRTVRTYVAQNDNASSGFDVGEDVAFLQPAASMPVFYSLDDNGKAMRFNKLASVNKKVIEFGFTYSTNGTAFTISAANFDLPKGVNAKLTDTYTGQSTNINKKSYTFTHNSSAPANRFELRFVGNTKSYKTIGLTEEDFETANVWFVADELNIVMEDALSNANVAVYDLAGQMVANKNFETLESAQIKVEGSGVFIVHITSNGESTRVKAVKM